jgi:hypothetical protein
MTRKAESATGAVDVVAGTGAAGTAERVDLAAENERLRSEIELLRKRAEMWENAYKGLEETAKNGNEMLQKCAEALQAIAPLRDPVAEAEEQERLIVERLIAERAARQAGNMHTTQEQATP